MLPNKKLLKLSRNHGQKLKKDDAPLDDSMDDFIVTRPLRAERKATIKSNNGASVSSVDDQTQNKLVQKKLKLTQAKSESEFVESDETSTILSAPEKTETCVTIKNIVPSEKSQLLGHGVPDSVKVSEQLSPRLPQLQRRKPTRRKAIDPSDLSLAIALSESLQSANENARQLEEELLLTENLAEVISDLRKDEEQGTGTILSHVFPMPADVPVVTKVKRKAKAKVAAKREPLQYTLALRSHAERERLIADRAASVLNHEPDDPLKPPKVTFTHPRPVSNYLRKYSQDERSLWQRASLNDMSNVDQLDVFYVSAFGSVISPPTKKCGYTNIMFHVSQLPGRNSSQMESFSNTQCILEELAFAAEGGFLDEPNPPENVVATSALPSAITKLTDDWSLFINNPLMSDLTIRTKSTDISAHRLVFTARFPRIVNHIVNKNSSDRFVLNWTSYSASSALKVLRFIYAASYEHDEEDARDVYRIARRHGINELIDLLPNQYESDAGTSEEDEDDSLQGINFEIDSSPKSSKKESFAADDLSGLSAFQKSVRFSETSQEDMEEKENDDKEEFDAHAESRSVSVSQHSESIKNVELSILDVEKDAKQNVQNTPSKEVSSEIHQMGRTITSAMDMEISSNITNKILPLSPDMFHETLTYSDEESKFAEDVVDLTQETNSDRQSERSFSPAAGSCEMNENSLDKADVAVAEYSITSSPPIPSFLQSPSLLQSPKNLLQNSPDNVVASCSRATPSYLIHDSFSSWSCYGGDIGNGSPVPEASLQLEKKKVEAAKPRTETDQYVDDEFPDELDSIFGPVHEPSPMRATVSLAIPCSADGVAVDINTPEGPRQAKKRKMDVTPLPDYQSMETPLLKQELVKYGLKPLKRSNAVKLLHHIYEELHPLVTDSESSFQDTPERGAVVEQRRTHQSIRAVPASPSKSSRDTSSYDDSESGHSQEDEESMIVMELDREIPDSQPDSPRRAVSLKDHMKEFLKKRPDIHKLVLTYEPISFEYLFAEIRKDRIRCKAQDLLDWLDQECITCRMKNRNRSRPANREADENPRFTPPKKVAPTAPAQKARRGVAKKLIP